MGLLVLLFLCAGPVSGQKSGGRHHHAYRTGGKARPDWVQIVNPHDVRMDEIRVRGTIPVAALAGSREASQFNETIRHEILSSVSDTLRRPGASVLSVDVTTFGAPSGNYKENALDAKELAESLRAYLMKDFDKEGAPSSVNVSYVPEDWDSITSLIDRSDIRFRSAALDVIRNVSVGAGRESQLMMLGSGSLYEQLRSEVFPQVCRVEYVVTVRIPVEGLSVSSREASVEQLYDTAMRYERTSRSFGDLIDLCQRLYPMSPDACINAAAVAMMRGQITRAKACLKGLDTNPRAYNNIGVLYFLRGNRSKAEVYLRMAEAMGVEEAGRVLKRIRR